MNVPTLLRAARAVIEDPKYWTKLFYEMRIHRLDGEVYTQRCALGALRSVAGLECYCLGVYSEPREYQLARECLGRAAHNLYPGTGWGITDVNDFVGHAAVLKVYDAALEECEVKEEAPCPILA